MKLNIPGLRWSYMVLACAIILTFGSAEAQAFRNVKTGDKTPSFKAVVAGGGGSVEYTPPTEEAIVLSFVRQGQDKSSDLIRDLSRLDPALKAKIQVLVLVVNPGDGDPVAWAKGLGADFPILVDENEKNYGLFGIVVAPETAVIAPDGTLKNSFSGYTSSLKVSLENELRAVLGIATDEKAAKGAEVNISPERRKAMRELQEAKMQIKRKMKSKAAPKVKKAIEEDKTFIEAYLLLGDLLIEEAATLDEAEGAFKKVIELEPKNSMGKVGLARVKAKRGQYEEAAGELEKTAMVSPDSGMMYYYLGMMHEAAGKMDKAALAYRKALEKILEEKESKD